MNFPISSRATVKPLSATEQDYGEESILHPRAPIKSCAHPLEASERSFKERREEFTLKNATDIFGLGFALHLKHERAAVRTHEIGHFGFLHKSEASYQSLIGDDEIDFDDILGQDRIVAPNPHLYMEKHAKSSRL